MGCFCNLAPVGLARSCQSPLVPTASCALLYLIAPGTLSAYSPFSSEHVNFSKAETVLSTFVSLVLYLAHRSSNEHFGFTNW